MGFSGGGQFAHRFLYLYPERIKAVSIGAPGTVTLLDASIDWPRGIKNTQELFNRDVNLAEMGRVIGIQLVVGADDVAIHGGEEFWRWLEETKSKFKLEEKGDDDQRVVSGGRGENMRVGRLETIRKLKEDWNEKGVEARLDIVPAVAHDWRGVQSTMLDFLGPLIEEQEVKV